MLDIIQNHSPIYVGLLAGFLFSAITIFGIVIFDPITKTWLHGNVSSNEIIGITLDGFTAIYGILLGLLAVGAYENVNSMEDIVSKEATNISVLYRDFRGYPEPMRQRLKNELKSYGKEVVEVSWPQQAKHISKIFIIAPSPTSHHNISGILESKLAIRLRLLSIRELNWFNVSA